MIPRLLKKLPSTEVLGPVLVIVSLQMLVYGISSSLPGTDIGYLFVVCLLAAILAWALSRSPFNGFYSSLLIAAVGLAGIWIVGARLFLPLLEWIAAVIELFPQIIPAIRENTSVDLMQVRESWVGGSGSAQCGHKIWEKNPS